MSRLELWTTAEIAEFLRLSPGWVRDSVVHEPSFPKPTRLPQAGRGRRRNRWIRSDVEAWALRHR